MHLVDLRSKQHALACFILYVVDPDVLGEGKRSPRKEMKHFYDYTIKLGTDCYRIVEVLSDKNTNLNAVPNP